MTDDVQATVRYVYIRVKYLMLTAYSLTDENIYLMSPLMTGYKFMITLHVSKL